jgi:hypothetical protein
VVKGTLVIEMRDRNVTLGPDEVFVVPRGVELDRFLRGEATLQDRPAAGGSPDPPLARRDPAHDAGTGGLGPPLSGRDGRFPASGKLLN